jgi:hypothetical protein
MVRVAGGECSPGGKIDGGGRARFPSRSPLGSKLGEVVFLGERHGRARREGVHEVRRA